MDQSKTDQEKMDEIKINQNKINQNQMDQNQIDQTDATKTEARQALNELTLMLMYLTKFSQSDRFYKEDNLSWKGYDFTTLDELEEADCILQGRHSTKSVQITAKGLQEAAQLLKKYQIADWKA